MVAAISKSPLPWLAIAGQRGAEWLGLQRLAAAQTPLLLPVLGIGLLLLALERQHSRAQWLLLLVGLALGLLPGMGWHGLHYLLRGSDALLLWGADGASRVLLSSGEGSDLGWRVPVLEVLEGGWPWLALWPFAVVLAWKQRHLSSGRWTLGLQLAWRRLCCRCARNCLVQPHSLVALCPALRTCPG